MSRFRLLALIEAYSVTGPAKNLLEFARFGARRGVETIVATYTRGEASNAFIESARTQGLDVHVIEERGLYDTAVVEALRGIARKVSPDIVQTHAVKSHFLARMAGLPEGAPWVAFHHGYTWPTARARLYNQLDRWSLRAARRVVTVSGPFREQMLARGVKGDRIEIVHNAIAPDWGAEERTPAKKAALRRELGISAESKVILIVGRLSAEKDHIALLQAIRGMKSAPVHLIVVGEGPERSRIEAKVRELGLGDRVSLTGQKKSAAPFYGIASLAVLSSLSEGSPNALLEAMAAGVPVVATNVGGIPEIVTHDESALLVQAGDVPAMSAAMDRLLEDPDFAQTLAARSHELIRLRHTPEARAEKLIEIYDSCRSSR